MVLLVQGVSRLRDALFRAEWRRWMSEDCQHVLKRSGGCVLGCAAPQSSSGLAACKILAISRMDASRVNQSRAHVRRGIMALWSFWTVVIL